MQFWINPSSRSPIHRQLSDQIREAVARGRLSPDDRLPSVRELSRTLVVNPNTIARVYRDLEQEGVLYARQGLGAFVAELKTELSTRARKRRLGEHLDRFLTEAVYLGFSAEEVVAVVTERVGQFQWKPSGTATR